MPGKEQTQKENRPAERRADVDHGRDPCTQFQKGIVFRLLDGMARFVSGNAQCRDAAGMAQIADIIKYEGDNSTFIWKHPVEDFNSMTQLIVHESQEAIFFMNGQALDLFGPGRHTLETQNIPILRKLINIPTDGETAFHCEVYFINKTVQMAIKWGTDSHVQYMDPVYNFPLSIGARGEMALSVADSRKLLIKLVGTENGIGQQKLVDFFKAFIFVDNYSEEYRKRKIAEEMEKMKFKFKTISGGNREVLIAWTTMWFMHKWDVVKQNALWLLP